MFDVCNDVDDLTDAFDHLIPDKEDDEGDEKPEEKPPGNNSSTDENTE